MIVLLSPAKSLDFSKTRLKAHSMPPFMAETEELVGILSKKSPNSIRKLMSVSEKLATLNVDRYQSFNFPFNLQNAKQSVLAFDGDVYTGFDAKSMSTADLKFADKHVRILSGLYGILKPLDLIQPYRLEMGTKLKNKKGKDLYAFWGGKITTLLNEELEKSKNALIVNLASNEYFKSVNKKEIQGDILDIDFRENRNGKWQFVSFSAKKARGLMTQFIVKNRIKKVANLKGFDYEDYTFNQQLSTANKWSFTR